MMLAFDPGALLSRTYVLPRGPRVRLRLARPGDGPAISALGAEHGLEVDALQVERLLRFDRRRLVICATALIGAQEGFAGFGAIDLEPGAEPGLVLVDEELTDGLGELLAAALSGRAGALTRFRGRRAAEAA
ncbi:MAG: hypothetical protein M3071_12230 [Actinomycetota bacterium]|nr:hypothetical protein [Actinomycetota bacterium]